MRYHFSTNQLGSELVYGKHYYQKFLLHCGIVQLGSGQCLTGNLVGSELVYGKHYCQKFLLCCGIVQLGSGQCLTGIGYA